MDGDRGEGGVGVDGGVEVACREVAELEMGCLYPELDAGEACFVD